MFTPLAFISGIIAAFTPCVVVLIPLILYRLSLSKHKFKDVGMFIFGYTVSFALLGFLLQQVLASQIANGFRLGFGLFFIVLGVLALMGKLNPINIPIVKNTAVLGALFSVLMIANPCSIPYLGAIISLENPALVFFDLLVFGIGSVLPAIVFAIAGKTLLDKVAKKTAFSKRIMWLLHLLLIISGVYLIAQITSFYYYDVLFAALLLIAVAFILARALFISRKPNELIKPQSLMLLLSLALIILAAVLQCQITDKAPNVYACATGNVLDCSICLRCILIFSIATLFIAFTLITYKKWNIH